MIKHELEGVISEAVRKAQAAGDLPTVPVPDVPLERPQRPEHGDYASSLAMRLARSARMSPLEIAGVIARHAEVDEGVASVDVAPPGFVNVRLAPSWLGAQVDAVLQASERFGDVPLGESESVQVEYVSANPVGPIHVGNGRGLALGDTLANVLTAAGYQVQREYLVNDAGTQTETFAATLYARYQQLFGREVEIPEGGYPGEYMTGLAEGLKEEKGDSLLLPPGEPYPSEVHDLGVARMMEVIKDDLALVDVHYDRWFSERSLYTDGTYEKTLSHLREGGFVTEREGAVWLSSSELGDEKDNVLVRSTGAQLVTLKRGTEVVRLSKRAGEIITLREVVEEVGADAVRFFFVGRAADSHMDFDIELAKRQSAENPVYYVQYAHARIAGILSHAKERIQSFDDGDVSLLTHESELALIRKMLQLPELVESVAVSLEPHQLPYYAMDLATAFHDFYEKCRVVSNDEAVSRARLKLVAAAKLVLARALGLIGVSAPERM
jgi:arginyl-tRNA synthetase